MYKTEAYIVDIVEILQVYVSQVYLIIVTLYSY
jgi:hypothetical protein